jgi:hypothetical protein
MASVACPFCFQRIDSSKLAYQCLGLGRKPCKSEVDKDRVELTGNTSPSYPTFVPRDRNAPKTCPVCESDKTRRACPLCHTALPIDFVNSDSPMIGIVGSVGSGKTLLMTVLVKQLREQVAKRFQAAVRMVTDNPDGMAGIEGYKQVRERPVFNDGRLPTKTSAQSDNNRRMSLALLWQGQPVRKFGITSSPTTVLSFVDTAGEDLGELNKAFTLRYLSVSDGLIVTLDPFALPGARARLNLPPAAIKSSDGTPLEVIARVTELLRTELHVSSKRKIRLPVAVVFTKIDAFFGVLDRNSPVMGKPPQLPLYSETDGQAVHEHVRALLHEWDAADIDLHMQHNYADFRYFAVSSLGAEPDYVRETVDAGGVRPHRVEDPVLWLLAKEKKVATA